MSYGDKGSKGPSPVGGNTLPADVKNIISTDNAELLVKHAELIGQQIAEAKLTTNQIRNVYGPVRQIELTWPDLTDHNSDPDRRRADKAFRQVLLLKPKLGYLAAKDNKLASLEKFFSVAIDEIAAAPIQERRVRFSRFVEFFEAILAYHKKYGGK